MKARDEIEDMQNLPISVIICARNAERTIEDCLSAVQGNNPAEIIVVDGNSTDRTLDIARRYTNKIFSDGGRELGYARQLGAEQATQEYITYVDADVILPQGTLSTLLAELKASGYCGISASIRGVSHASYWERAIDEHLNINRHRSHIWLGAGLLPRSTVLKYGFDPFIKGGEDVDFNWRLERDGHRFGTSSSVVYHHHKTDLRSTVRYGYWYGRGKARLAWKHGLFKLRIWPPLWALYMAFNSLRKGKVSPIPLYVVSAVVQSAGMVKGFIEVIKEDSPYKPPRPSLRLSI